MIRVWVRHSEGRHSEESAILKAVNQGSLHEIVVGVAAC